jgi:hypothetical protein
VEVEDDCLLGKAANTFHYENECGTRYVEYEKTGGKHIIPFAFIEVENFGEIISRVYVYPKWRKGDSQNLKQKTLKIEDIAKLIGFTEDHRELLVPGWMFEQDV